MKKIFKIVKIGFRKYFAALAETNAMCPSCTLPCIGSLYFGKSENNETVNNGYKAA